jgi:ABC-type maltose transport system permease subunit
VAAYGELYEAAELDGASIWQRVRHIASIPMVIIFMIFQRSILSGLSAGALKG